MINPRRQLERCGCDLCRMHRFLDYFRNEVGLPKLLLMGQVRRPSGLSFRYSPRSDYGIVPDMLIIDYPDRITTNKEE